MLNISNLSKSYGDRIIFSDVTINAGVRDRIAVIGPNGSGKTTLFELIAGNVMPDTGDVSIPKGATIGYLEQDIKPSSRRELLHDVANASSRVTAIKHRIEVLEQEITDGADGDYLQRTIRELGELQQQFEAVGGYDAEHEAKIILSGLGFAESDFSRPMNEFSGGWLMRAELAKLLLLNPDVLLLDEPTNHLDIESCVWFEEYLQSYQGAVLVTSHDREFLNRVVSKVLAIEPDGVILHRGNYNSYVMARQKDLEAKEAAARRQEQKIKKDMRFIESFRADKRRASQVQSRLKRLEKMERIEVPRATSRARISFPEPARSGEDVVTLKNILKAYGSNIVYHDLNLVLRRGDKVALVGPNGAGKTTLLKILAGVITFEKGLRRLGHNVNTAYYAQYQLEQLNPENTVLNELRRLAPDEPEQRLRGILGAFLFTGDEVEKRVSVLSGGEKARLAISRMLIRPANFLLMDEPTNHLDIPSREVLTDALEDYKGTLCFITHDRTLIRQIANKIIEIRDGNLDVYPGDYDGFLVWKAEFRSDERRRDAFDSASRKKEGKERQQNRKQIEGEVRNRFHRMRKPIETRVEEIEKQIDRLEAELGEAEALLADPGNYGDDSRAIDTVDRYRKLKKSISSLTEEWEKKSLELERLKVECEREIKLL
ncbi:MAG: ATP-binding cassette domain-containing protein [Dehalococcoidia bacterium]